MDAEIVYCADEKYREQLERLRKRAGDILSAPFSEEDYLKEYRKAGVQVEHYPDMDAFALGYQGKQ